MVWMGAAVSVDTPGEIFFEIGLGVEVGGVKFGEIGVGVEFGIGVSVGTRGDGVGERDGRAEGAVKDVECC